MWHQTWDTMHSPSGTFEQCVRPMYSMSQECAIHTAVFTATYCLSITEKVYFCASSKHDFSTLPSSGQSPTERDRHTHAERLCHSFTQEE